MEFRMFGPDNFPGSRFRKGIETFLSLDNEQWIVLHKWFLSTSNFDPADSLSNQTIVASSLLPDQFVASVEVLCFLLQAWHQYQLELADIQRDLLLLNYTPDQIERIKSFLQPLEKIKARVFAAYVRNLQEEAVLPTLQEVNLVCDLRAIFEDYAYPPPEARKTSHTRILSFSQVVLMELLAEDSFGRKQKLSFQMNEQEFNDLFQGVQRAREQLDILKKKASVLTETLE